MPHIKQMFPSKYLSFQDLEVGKLYEATIRMVVLEQVNVRPNSWGPGRGVGGSVGWGSGHQAPAQPDNEPSWLLYFEEFDKPIKLKKTRAEKIATILGVANTDAWAGLKLRFYRGAWSNGGASGEGLMIDDRPADPRDVTHQLPQAGSRGAVSGWSTQRQRDPQQAPQPRKELPVFDVRPIGAKNAEAFRAAMAEQGLTQDDVLAWLKRHERDVYERVWGQELSDWPRGISASMQKCLRLMPEEARRAAQAPPSPIAPPSLDPQSAPLPGTVPGAPGTREGGATSPGYVASVIPGVNFGKPPPEPLPGDLEADDIPF